MIPADITDIFVFLGWLPLIQSVRHGSKAVTRHRKPLHFLKQKLLAVTQYIPPARELPPGAYPSDQEQDDLMTVGHLCSFTATIPCLLVRVFGYMCFSFFCHNTYV